MVDKADGNSNELESGVGRQDDSYVQAMKELTEVMREHTEVMREYNAAASTRRSAKWIGRVITVIGIIARVAPFLM